jgi:hypothetical protein
VSAGAVTGVAVLVSAALLVAVLYLVARDRARGHDVGTPDSSTDEVVSGLMAELRKWQAEATQWKATAERLQRELDQR